jgi:hypothetical protein
MTESIGVRWIGKAKSDVELPIGVAASTTTVLDSALSVESKPLVGLGSEASGGKEQFHYVRVIPLIHPCGDFALALGHDYSGLVPFLHHEPLRCPESAWTGFTTAGARVVCRNVVTGDGLPFDPAARGANDSGPFREPVFISVLPKELSQRGARLPATTHVPHSAPRAVTFPSSRGIGVISK